MVKEKLQGHFVDTRNVVYESARYSRWKRELGETTDRSMTELHKQADRCVLCAMRKRLVRDLFVVGLLDQHLPEALQMNTAIALATSTGLAKVRTSETAKKQQTNSDCFPTLLQKFYIC